MTSTLGDNNKVELAANDNEKRKPMKFAIPSSIQLNEQSKTRVHGLKNQGRLREEIKEQFQSQEMKLFAEMDLLIGQIKQLELEGLETSPSLEDNQGVIVEQETLPSLEVGNLSGSQVKKVSLSLPNGEDVSKLQITSAKDSISNSNSNIAPSKQRRRLLDDGELQQVQGYTKDQQKERSTENNNNRGNSNSQSNNLNVQELSGQLVSSVDERLLFVVGDTFATSIIQQTSFIGNPLASSSQLKSSAWGDEVRSSIKATVVSGIEGEGFEKQQQIEERQGESMSRSTATKEKELQNKNAQKEQQLDKESERIANALLSSSLSEGNLPNMRGGSLSEKVEYLDGLLQGMESETAMWNVKIDELQGEITRGKLQLAQAVQCHRRELEKVRLLAAEEVEGMEADRQKCFRELLEMKESLRSTQLENGVIRQANREMTKIIEELQRELEEERKNEKGQREYEQIVNKMERVMAENAELKESISDVLFKEVKAKEEQAEVLRKNERLQLIVENLEEEKDALKLQSHQLLLTLAEMQEESQSQQQQHQQSEQYSNDVYINEGEEEEGQEEEQNFNQKGEFSCEEAEQKIEYEQVHDSATSASKSNNNPPSRRVSQIYNEQTKVYSDDCDMCVIEGVFEQNQGLKEQLLLKEQEIIELKTNPTYISRSRLVSSIGVVSPKYQTPPNPRMTQLQHPPPQQYLQQHNPAVYIETNDSVNQSRFFPQQSFESSSFHRPLSININSFAQPKGGAKSSSQNFPRSPAAMTSTQQQKTPPNKSEIEYLQQILASKYQQIQAQKNRYNFVQLNQEFSQ